MNTKKLGALIKFLNTKKHYVIIMIPHGNPGIKLTKFTSLEILSVMEKVKECYSIEVWYSLEKLNLI